MDARIKKIKDILQVNGYNIRYNPMWKAWQVSHPKAGAVSEFKNVSEAISHAQNG